MYLFLELCLNLKYIVLDDSIKEALLPGGNMDPKRGR